MLFNYKTKFKTAITVFFAFITIFLSSNLIAKSDALSLEKLQEFVDVFEYIKDTYVDEIKDEELFKNAIKGMVSSLDPHSNYLEPKEQKKLEESTRGKFGGLGIVINMNENGLVEIISPIDDTPAYDAGLQPNDLIVKIDDKEVKGMSLDSAVKLMRGEPGTTITLTIARKNVNLFPVELTRAIITIDSVKGYLLNDNVAYTRISSFQQPTIKLLKEEINKLEKENKKPLAALILDLRNNPGGLLSSAVAISDLFLDDKGLIVYTKGRIPSSLVSFSSKKGDILKNKPIVVLINGGTASASEIVSGALQDHNRAIIIGQASFGKGSVQTARSLPSGYGLKITTARYYTPSGRSIQAKGIEPDIELQNIELNDVTKTFVPKKEENLTGHLENESNDKEKKDTKDKNSKKDAKEEKLSKTEENRKKQKGRELNKLYKDYFVHEALNILKGISILNK